MRMYDYLKDSQKVLHRKPIPRRRLIVEPVEPEDVKIPKDYMYLTKNDLVKLLWGRGIPHNKRMLKAELITLLEEDDRRFR